MNKKAIGLFTEILWIIVGAIVLIALLFITGLFVFTPIKGFAVVIAAIGSYLAIKNNAKKDHTVFFVGIVMIAAATALFLLVKA